MYTDETPRSVGYGTPRDDRFYTPRGANDYRNSSSEGDYGTPRDNKDTHDSEYLVPNPHNYWNEIASNKNEDFEEDESAFGMMEGVSEKDVSYSRIIFLQTAL
jgi:hypothetical protein